MIHGRTARWCAITAALGAVAWGCADAPAGSGVADTAGATDTGVAPDSTVSADSADGASAGDGFNDPEGYGYLVAEPPALNFGIRPVGDAHTLAIELENAGTRVLTIGALELEGSSPAFAFTPQGPLSLPSGAKDHVRVTFFALDPVPYDDALLLHSDSATGAVTRIPLSGGGIIFDCVDLDGDLHGPYCDAGEDCDQANPKVHASAPEICNGIDDDCNGLIDEEWVALGSACTASHGACEVTGARVCNAEGDGLKCAVNPVTGGAELCNEVDDDCNGATDEDFPEIGDACFVGEGACRVTDKWICAPDGSGVICNVIPPPAGVEVLGDGIDNDCDGQIDEEPATDVGCADGEREGFTDLATWPSIAACSGAWSVGGVISNSLGPTCARQAGDDVAATDGMGCGAADLCAEGWHVCDSAADVAASSATGCVGADPDEARLFFVARASGTGCGQCATGEVTGGSCNSPVSCRGDCQASPSLSNDLFGCGSLGASPAGGCAPLDAFSHNNCGALLPPWSCSGSQVEATNVVKRGPEHGGVLCCRDR